ncbi:MAG: PIG-L deacetylase family protein, partial [Terriglobales bacterium]
MLLAAHPDDEVVGAAGWAWQHAPPLSVAFLTRGVPLDRRCFAPGFHDPEIYANTRRREAEAVWRRHRRRPSLFFAPFTDQGLYLELKAAASWLKELVAAVRPGVILAPAYEAGHPD